jgi:uncharacterized membrane protein (UPF0127 family)
MLNVRLAFRLLLLFIACVAGCGGNTSGLPTVKMDIGQRSYTLEVAATEEAQEHGLMERDSMPADHGMIFVFPAERVLNFWMKNTRFDLDIVFVDGEGKVVSIRHMKAYDLNTTSSIYPAKYAIELNTGQNNASGVKVGEKLTIPKGARDAAK